MPGRRHHHHSRDALSAARQIWSGSASFTDVPVGAEFFAEIEAMKAGLSAGCTATTYCPDENVTRRQMAAFFARALGLYWQY